MTTNRFADLKKARETTERKKVEGEVELKRKKEETRLRLHKEFDFIFVVLMEYRNAVHPSSGVEKPRFTKGFADSGPLEFMRNNFYWCWTINTGAEKNYKPDVEVCIFADPDSLELKGVSVGSKIFKMDQFNEKSLEKALRNYEG
jgi:hypothetical protein